MKYQITWRAKNPIKKHLLGQTIKVKFNSKWDAKAMIDRLASKGNNVSMINAYIEEVA